MAFQSFELEAVFGTTSDFYKAVVAVFLNLSEKFKMFWTRGNQEKKLCLINFQKNGQWPQFFTSKIDKLKKAATAF